MENKSGASPVNATPHAAPASPTIIKGRRPAASATRPAGAFSNTRAKAGAASTNPTPDDPRPRPSAYLRARPNSDRDRFR